MGDGVVQIAGIAQGAIDQIETVLSDAVQFVANTATDIGNSIANGLSIVINAVGIIRRFRLSCLLVVSS